MKTLNNLVLGAASRRAAFLRRQRADRWTVRISVLATVILILVAVFMPVKAGGLELWLGGNFTHLSQLDAGPPFNENDEDSVDHLGIDLTLRYLQGDWAWYAGVSAGRNFNVTDCSKCWNDGGAEVDTLLKFGFQKRLYKW